MTTAVELLRQGRRDEFWQRYCGFFDLGLDEFMAIQERLLLEQLRLLADCELGRKLLGGKAPLTVSEFRRTAPVTIYRDYVPYLTDRREDILPVKPVCWMRTSGRTGEYRGKWVPVPPAYYNRLARSLITTVTLSGARRKGDVLLEEDATLLYVAAPPPFITGTTMRAVADEFPVRFIPPLAEAEKLSFQERVQRGFAESMGSGIDFFAGVASILMRIGVAFTEGTRQMSLSPGMLRPAVVLRLLQALARSKMEGRGLLPKDIWRPKGITASGMDVGLYRARIYEMWGHMPLEAYACTEFGGIAIQAWGARRPGLTPFPDSAFWEFLPEAEYAAWRANTGYRPRTLLLNELQPGRYVLVGTSFSGGAFVRYICGDLIRVLAVNDEELGIRLPQIVMESRADDTINLGSMVVLTERSLWEAIGHANLAIPEWIAVKVLGPSGQEPRINICLERDSLDPAALSATLNESLIETNDEYASFHEIIGGNPITVTMFTPGTFLAYMEEKQAEGADPGQLKPPRMQPPPQVKDRLAAISARLERSGR